MEAGAGIADLGAGDERQAVAEAGGGGRAAGALRDVLVDLAVFIGAGAKTLDRGDDHRRVDAPGSSPRESPCDRARRGRNSRPCTSHRLIRRGRERSLPFGFLVSSVIERLLWLSMVK